MRGLPDEATEHRQRRGHLRLLPIDIVHRHRADRSQIHRGTVGSYRLVAFLTHTVA